MDGLAVVPSGAHIELTEVGGGGAWRGLRQVAEERGGAAGIEPAAAALSPCVLLAEAPGRAPRLGLPRPEVADPILAEGLGTFQGTG